MSSLKAKYKFLEEEYRREKAGFTSSRQEPFTRDEETDMSARRRGGSPNIGTGVDLDTYLNLQEERDRLYASNVKLQEEKAELLSRLKRVQIDACSMNEDRIRSLESERCHLISKQTELNSRLGELEEENRGLKRKLYVHENELSEERNSLNSIRRVQEQTDQALLSFRKTHDNLESQIRELKDQNCRLDAEKDSLVTQVESLREDNARMRSCMMSLDGQKDSILMTLDSKIDLISRLERDMCSKDSKIEQLEDRIAKFKTTVDETLNLNKRTERELKLANSEVERLKVELNNIDLEKSRAQAELRRIQAELYEVNQHNRTIQQELEASKSEAEEVKLQLQHYCCEVQRIEEILNKKVRISQHNM
uniref:Centrosomal protein of 135 kDa n=1 Tax=Cacopsylla melanoneura TaxID=428564 RepID=A0A8D9E3Z8_9HEMI